MAAMHPVSRTRPLSLRRCGAAPSDGATRIALSNSPWCALRGRRPRPRRALALHVHFFRDDQGILKLYSKITHCTFKLGVTEQQMHRT